MVFTCSTVVEAPVDEVFAWHARRGAITRLMPPWQPVRVVSEAASLRDGRAVLAVPPGLRWVAAHDSDGYEPPHRFVDRIAGSPPLSWALSWQHTHEFRAENAVSTVSATRMTDTVDTTVPAALLRPMFAYRHAQLAADLDVHARARAWAPEPVTVAITGASGLVGAAVAALLSTGGHRVVRLVRRAPRADDERRWDPAAPAADLLTGVDAVVHLAGAGIAGRFTDAHKAAIRDSRIGPTRRLAERAATTTDGPAAFVSASGIGFYGADRGDELLAETSPRGAGFLADVVSDWEDATAPAAEAGLRCVRVRTGIVQSPRGGALRLQYPLFAAGLGGRVGAGDQWQSWIGIDDLADIYLRAVCDPGLSGPVNAVAPHPVRASEYAHILAGVLHRPALLPVPEIGPRVLLGREGASELALADQRVTPGRLREAGHDFRHATLEEALRHVLGRRTSVR
jgi:uncharacterized protein